jgi:hypothetical protein
MRRLAMNHSGFQASCHNMMPVYFLTTISPQSFLERTLAEFYTILLEEHLHVALEMLELGTSSSLQSPKLTRVVQRCSHLVTALAREDAEVHFHALQTTTEQLQLSEWEHCRLGKLLHYSKITSGSLDALD